MAPFSFIRILDKANDASARPYRSAVGEFCNLLSLTDRQPRLCHLFKGNN